MKPLLQIRATVGGGVFLAMPEPSGIQLTYQDLDNSESRRTADGTIFRDRIDVKIGGMGCSFKHKFLDKNGGGQ